MTVYRVHHLLCMYTQTCYLMHMLAALQAEIAAWHMMCTQAAFYDWVGL